MARAARLALDVSSGLSLFDVRAELAVVRPLKANVLSTLEGTLDLADTPPKVPTARDREGEWLPQLVLGADISPRYSDEDSVLLGGEYFYNSLGDEDASLYPALLAAPMFLPNQRVQGFSPLYNGRHYAGADAMFMSPGSWNDHSFTLGALGNLSDESYLTRLDRRENVLTFLSVSVFGTYHYGEPGEFRLGFEIPPIPAFGGNPGLPEGLKVVPPRFEAGVTLVVNI